MAIYPWRRQLSQRVNKPELAVPVREEGNIMRRFLPLLLSIVLVTCTKSTGQKGIPTPQPSPLPDSPADIALVEGVIRDAIDVERKTVLALITAKTSIENIDISSDGNWAVGWLIPIDPETNEPVPIEPGLVLMQKIGEEWLVWLPTTNGWAHILAQIPDELLSPEHKRNWDRQFGIQAVNVPTAALSGYKLPWEAGVTRRLTQSTCHDQYIPSGNAHYSFDFSTRGELWEIYASKAGRMWLWKDDVPTCNEYTCSDHQPIGNYVVLKDESTDPATYQLYLHLKQNSIPDELKEQGKLIGQGQLIGIVDNTGQSWGSHLHFQVQVPLYGENYYWGRAVDITFEDVDINGGRPRVINAWCNDKIYCDRSGDVCNDFRENYTSQNEITTEGPQNIYIPLIKQEENVTETATP